MTERRSAPMEEALGRSDSFVAFQQKLSRVARVERPVLILGERGTGKELAATRLHFLSNRWNEPLVTLNCAAMAPTLIATELFGHEAGAFTGAVGRRMGRFEAAHRGTLFLDEIGNIPLEAQEKILRVVEYGAFERVGSSSPVRVDVRIIAATHADLPELANQGRFKLDLLDRLSFEVLFLPPLRERHGDIPLLTSHFASRMARELDLPSVPDITDDAMDMLERHGWPGNIRELKNAVERAVYRAQGEPIQTIVFDPFHPSSSSTLPAPPPPALRPELTRVTHASSGTLHEAVRTLEVAMLQEALVENRYNQKQAARRLGLTYHQFRGLFRKHAKSLGPTEKKP
jgi:psp operon transcriptional activator